MQLKAEKSELLHLLESSGSQCSKESCSRLTSPRSLARQQLHTLLVVQKKKRKSFQRTGVRSSGRKGLTSPSQLGEDAADMEARARRDTTCWTAMTQLLKRERERERVRERHFCPTTDSPTASVARTDFMTWRRTLPHVNGPVSSVRA